MITPEEILALLERNSQRRVCEITPNGEMIPAYDFIGAFERIVLEAQYWKLLRERERELDRMAMERWQDDGGPPISRFMARLVLERPLPFSYYMEYRRYNP